MLRRAARARVFRGQFRKAGFDRQCNRRCGRRQGHANPVHAGTRARGDRGSAVTPNVSLPNVQPAQNAGGQRAFLGGAAGIIDRGGAARSSREVLDEHPVGDHCGRQIRSSSSSAPAEITHELEDFEARTVSPFAVLGLRQPDTIFHPRSPAPEPRRHPPAGVLFWVRHKMWHARAEDPPGNSPWVVGALRQP